MAAPSEEVTVINFGETVLSSLSPGTAATKRKVKRKQWDRNFYIGDVTQLVNGLAVNGTVWKGTDGAATLYCCGKSIYGQGILSAELSITINAQVEAPGHGKWWLDGKTGNDKCYCQQCMCIIVTPEAKVTNGVRPMQQNRGYAAEGAKGNASGP